MESISDILANAKRIIAQKRASHSTEGGEVGATRTVLSGSADSAGKNEGHDSVPSDGKGSNDGIAMNTANPTGTDNVNVSKKPLESDNAFCSPKEASAIGADLMNSIANYKQASAPAGTANTADTVTAPEAKQASGNQLELTSDVLAKIASVVLSNEEGYKYAEKLLAKEAGAEAAEQAFGTIQKQAAFDKGAQDAELLIREAIAVDQEKQAMEMDKQAAANDYQAGADLAEQLLVKAAQAPMGPPQGAPAGPPQGAPMGPEGGAPQGAPMGPEGGAPVEPATPEEIMEAIAMMVQQGQLAPEEAEQVMMLLSGQGGGAQAAPAGPPQGENIPMPAPSAPGMEVAASAAPVDFERQLINTINYNRSMRR